MPSTCLVCCCVLQAAFAGHRTSNLAHGATALCAPQVGAVKLVSPPEAQTMLDQISLSVNSIATAWWEVRHLGWALQMRHAAGTVWQQIHTVALCS